MSLTELTTYGEKRAEFGGYGSGAHVRRDGFIEKELWGHRERPMWYLVGFVLVLSVATYFFFKVI